MGMAAMRQQKQREGSGLGSGAPPFLVKTHEMVEERATDEVISWGEKGVSFVVWKPVEFARDLLPFHFKHNNFSSFVRQLNTYGFHKVVPDRWEFANDNFRRGYPTLLSEIRRRKARPSTAPLPRPAAVPSNLDPPPTYSAEVHSSSITSSPPPPPRLHLLSSENKKLRRDNQALSLELVNAKRHYDELLGLLSNYVEVRRLDVSCLMRGVKGEENAVAGEESDEEEEEGEKNGASMKLFGVLMKENRADGRKRKRRRCDGGGGMTTVGGSWFGDSSPVGESCT
ncbi:Heat stress transcription factor B-1 [Platanthera zijinensis]|uniref:Heat stress transcription factor B-1 n=1 Tax=Platanthera zijinensis TaxID=2320716 RepID=A0AAP0G0M5_9ASPA